MSDRIEGAAPAPDSVICYAGPWYGAVHRVVSREGRFLWVRPVCSHSAVPFQVHVSDTEPVPGGGQ